MRDNLNGTTCLATLTGIDVGGRGREWQLCFIRGALSRHMLGLTLTRPVELLAKHHGSTGRPGREKWPRTPGVCV